MLQRVVNSREDYYFILNIIIIFRRIVRIEFTLTLLLYLPIPKISGARKEFKGQEMFFLFHSVSCDVCVASLPNPIFWTRFTLGHIERALFFIRVYNHW